MVTITQESGFEHAADACSGGIGKAGAAVRKIATALDSRPAPTVAADTPADTPTNASTNTAADATAHRWAFPPLAAFPARLIR